MTFGEPRNKRKLNDLSALCVLISRVMKRAFAPHVNINGFSHTEIADIFGLPCFETLMSRLRQRESEEKSILETPTNDGIRREQRIPISGHIPRQDWSSAGRRRGWPNYHSNSRCFNASAIHNHAGYETLWAKTCWHRAEGANWTRKTWKRRSNDWNQHHAKQRDRARTYLSRCWARIHNTASKTKRYNNWRLVLGCQVSWRRRFREEEVPRMERVRCGWGRNEGLQNT